MYLIFKLSSYRIAALSLVLFFFYGFTFSLQSQSKTDSTEQNIGISVYSAYAYNKTSNNFISLGLSLENKLGGKNKIYFSNLYDISVYSGMSNAKDNYMLNLNFGLRLCANAYENVRLYFDILSGLTQHKPAGRNDIYFGSNSKVLLGIQYDIFAVEFSGSYYNTIIESFSQGSIGLKINLE
jgi:hypothetical protein